MQQISLLLSADWPTPFQQKTNKLVFNSLNQQQSDLATQK